MTTLASLEHVTRTFGAVTALDDVSLAIDSGSVVGLLGPNGAGKSTLLSIIQGLRRPDAGTVTLFGGSPRDARTRIRLGCTPQETALPDPLKVGEVVDFVGAHFDDRVPTAELAERFGFSELLRRQTGSLSGGQRRRLSVALAFVGRPRLVLLDEPTTGLDVDARRTLWDALRREHAEGATVVVTSHYLEEIEALAERVVVIDGGRVLADDRLERVLSQVGLRRVTLTTTEPALAQRLPGVMRTEVDDAGAMTFSVTDSDAFVTRLVQEGIPFGELLIRGATLEEAFLTLTHGPNPDGSARLNDRKDSTSMKEVA